MTTEPITEDQWCFRAAVYYVSRGVVPPAAEAIAQVLLDDLEGDTSGSPEEAAADDMSIWSE